MLSEFQRSLIKKEDAGKKMQYYSIVLLFIASVVAFGAIRVAEIASLCTTNPLVYGVMSIILVASLISFVLKPSKTGLGLVRKMALIGLVVHQIKKGIDGDMKKNMSYKSLQGSVSIVTGGNSGIGFAVVEQLLSRNSTVVMTCRSEIKCRIAASKLKKLCTTFKALLNYLQSLSFKPMYTPDITQHNTSYPEHQRGFRRQREHRHPIRRLRASAASHDSGSGRFKLHSELRGLLLVEVYESRYPCQ